ncbi:MAG: GntG family PLP-dependent aldolase [Thermoanaerobaculia bacterium]
MKRALSDFRSDTVTRPTAAMRRAMAEAEVGDDVYREDPTVRRLEEETAERLGLAAALFVPSGTMGNQIALRIHARSGTEVILEARSHIFHFELGGMASLSGLLPRPVVGDRGRLPAAAVQEWIRPEGVDYFPHTSVIAVENTHNYAGGSVIPREGLDEILALARQRNLLVHLDGARLWNAAVAQNVSEASLAAGFDSVMVCFSKGLRAPVGSAVAGSKEFVAEARKVRKLFGGGMRQVGVIAAGALIAIRHERGRLVEDHVRARRLAEALAPMPGITLDPATVETNVVLVTLDAAKMAVPAFIQGLKDEDVLCGAGMANEVRFLTHADVGDADVERAIAAVRKVLGS